MSTVGLPTRVVADLERNDQLQVHHRRCSRPRCRGRQEGDGPYLSVRIYFGVSNAFKRAQMVREPRVVARQELVLSALDPKSSRLGGAYCTQEALCGYITVLEWKLLDGTHAVWVSPWGPVDTPPDAVRRTDAGAPRPAGCPARVPTACVGVCASVESFGFGTSALWNALGRVSANAGYRSLNSTRPRAVTEPRGACDAARFERNCEVSLAALVGAEVCRHGWF